MSSLGGRGLKMRASGVRKNQVQKVQGSESCDVWDLSRRRLKEWEVGAVLSFGPLAQ